MRSDTKKRLSEMHQTNLCVGAECCDDRVLIGVFKIDKSRLQALIHLGNLRHVAECAAVDVVNADNVSVRSERLQDGRSGR